MLGHLQVVNKLFNVFFFGGDITHKAIVCFLVLTECEG